MLSSGHAHGSIDTHEDSVALLLDVLRSRGDTQTETSIDTSRHGDKETETVRACVDTDSLLLRTDV